MPALRISRTNNDANVLVLSAEIIAPAMAEELEELLEVWLSTTFEGRRHEPRIAQLGVLDRREPLS